jgi:hypothetical protein
MKRYGKGFAGRLANIAAICITTFFLLFPSSTSVLCIAPDSHIAIEDIHAECCVSVHLAAPDEKQGRDRLSASNICGNCTDLFIFLYGREANRKSQIAAASSQHVELFGNQLPADLTCSLLRQSNICDINTATPASSVPLRC